MDKEIIFEVDNEGVALLTLNRPHKYNALTNNMVDNLWPMLIDRVQEEQAVRCLVITGAGKAFCTGGDVNERLKGLATGEVKRKHPEDPLGSFILRMPAIKKPIIAAINGMAAGIGLSLALLADIRIASSSARFCVVFIRRGIMPDGGMTVTLPLIVGLPKALELAMTGDVIDSSEALRIGLVNRVVPDERLKDEALVLARRLANSPPMALAFIKRGMYRSIRASLEEAAYFESWGQNTLRNTRDHHEALQAFQEKRHH